MKYPSKKFERDFSGYEEFEYIEGERIEELYRDWETIISQE